jgi:succinate-semialdehyde dehydrogenase / glutarate-semialdehyde dehydrogenase
MPIATLNPSTEEIEATFTAHSAEEIEGRLARASAAVVTLRATGFADRAAWMERAADLLESEVEEVATLLTREMGKTIRQSRAEVLKCARAARYYAAHAERFLAAVPLEEPAVVGASAAWTRYQPMGVILAVMPWNYPLWQVVRFAAPALMAGNAGLLKHASNVPQTALYLDRLFERAGFPEGAFQSLLIPASAVEPLVRDRRVAAVTLTGSEPAGRSLGGIAGSEIKKSVLELGGSDPFIVMPSADLDAAAAAAVTARTMNNGQSCIAGKRFIVHTDVYDAFVTRFADGIRDLKVGDPLDESTDLGPLATRSGREEILALVEDAVAHGARMLVGGGAVPAVGWYVGPVVLEGITPRMRLHAEEAFGPVATLYRAADAQEAIAIANGTTFGLGASVWSGDPAEQELFVDAIESGAVFVNGMTISHPELPFGGVKDSGIGRELAAEGIREFCNLKTVWKA